MQNTRIAALRVLSMGAWAYQTGPSNTINVHVRSSRLAGCSSFNQILSVVIDGKPYELGGIANDDSTLAPGDYKSKLVNDEHKTSYEYSQINEFYFPDGKTRKYYVVERTE